MARERHWAIDKGIAPKNRARRSARTLPSCQTAPPLDLSRRRHRADRRPPSLPHDPYADVRDTALQQFLMVLRIASRKDRLAQMVIPTTAMAFAMEPRPPPKYHPKSTRPAGTGHYGTTAVTEPQ